MAPHHRPSLSITLPPSPQFPTANMPATPEAQHHDQHSQADPPPPPRPQPFKVKRKRVSSVPFHEHTIMADTVIPTIEMSEVPSAEVSSPTLQPTSAHHLLSPVPASFSRGLTPPRTPAPKSSHPTFSQLESPAEEWDLINRTKPAFERSGSICSSFSDSSVSSYGSSDFSLPNGGYDSPDSEAPDPFTDGPSLTKHDTLLQSPIRKDDLPKPKRVKTRRDIKWSQQMDDHLWMTFMAYLSDPTLTPFKMLPGSTPPMGVCDQVASKAKRTWHPRKAAPVTVTPGSIDALLESSIRQREGSPDTIRPTSLQTLNQKWPKVAATRRRLRELCARRPSISAHYQRMLRTRSPSPFETSSSSSQPVEPTSSFSGFDMVKSLVTSTAPSMQPNGPLAQLANDVPRSPPQAPRAQPRPLRPEGWFDRIPRSKAHQKSASLQSELKLSPQNSFQMGADALASPFDSDAPSSRSHLLQSMAATRSLGRTEFNGRSLDSPVEFKVGAPTDRRSRKRRFRSDEEKPRRGALEHVFGPPMQHDGIVRNRGFSVGAVRATDNLARLFTPPSINVDLVMGEAGEETPREVVPIGSLSAPRRLAEPVPRLGSPFVEPPVPSRQHNTFPRTNLLPSVVNQEPFHQRLMQLAAEHGNGSTSN